MHSEFSAHVRVGDYSHSNDGVEPQILRILFHKKFRM